MQVSLLQSQHTLSKTPTEEALVQHKGSQDKAAGRQKWGKKKVKSQLKLAFCKKGKVQECALEGNS